MSSLRFIMPFPQSDGTGSDGSGPSIPLGGFDPNNCLTLSRWSNEPAEPHSVWRGRCVRHAAALPLRPKRLVPFSLTR